MTEEITSATLETAETAPSARWRGFGLSGRVLLLIIGFVMLAEIAIYVPSVANFRNNWLNDRLSAAYIAALVLEVTPADMVPEALSRELLENVGAKTIVIKIHNSRRLLAVSDMPPMVDETFDARTASAWEAITASWRALLAPPGRTLNVIGAAPMGGDSIEITLDEGQLQAAMRRYSINILWLSLAISLMVAALAVAALHLLVLRPVARLTTNLMQFGANPEDASRIIIPSGQAHELGRAEEALATMQKVLVRELNQKKHLAALGLAVAKINHDLRNMLASAQLLTDRLADVPDPLTQRLAPKLVATLDRAIRFCQSTLAYGRAVDEAPKFAKVKLHALVAEAVESVQPVAGGIECVQDVSENLEIRADEDQMLRVLVNLGRNAVEALSGAGASGGQAPCIKFRAWRVNRDVLLEVSDNGPGFTPRARQKLFEAFQGSTRAGGSGLGLAIAADLVRAHGGTIMLAPQIAGAGGATFRIVLPQG